MTNDQLIIAIFAIIVICILLKKHTDKDGKLLDGSVTKNRIITLLRDFSPIPSNKLKFGYTEKSIQNQLEKFFQKEIQHVTKEYAIEGVNSSQIDLDLGNGAIGIELKLASAVFKEFGKDRLVGQVSKYIDRKYDDGNLIVLIYCTQDEFAKTTSKNQIIQALEKYDVEIVFSTLKPHP